MTSISLEDITLHVQNKQPQPIKGLHELVIPLKKGYMRRDNEFGYHVHVYDHKNRQFQGVLTMSGSILYELSHSGYRPMDFSEDKKEEIYTKLMEKPIPEEHWRLPGKNATIFYDPNH